MYELFILGELMDKPMHGYLLQHVLDKVVGPNRKISWGVLYPLIQRMTKEELIEQHIQEEGGRGRPKKNLHITSKGKERFVELMEEKMPYDQTTEDLFDIKLSNFHHVSEQMQVKVLHQYEEYLHYLLDYLLHNSRNVEDQEQISTTEKASILRVLQLRKAKIEVQLNWVKEEKEERDQI
ncbi:PadR family transcriptional regulator [Halobacillus salinus]|uniref:PadR family transcriptional regulator n=1 Tax=Halobacillus salinus TaxID=192814 RepID=A0A4Z0H021_9BACI|nr:PadR family transcriptional regulator [Halobacillus salinus]TGB02338.1 PadR family transcriptional regulator [Halobacillus salinus]